MKLTENRIRQIIKEEVDAMHEAEGDEIMKAITSQKQQKQLQPKSEQK